MLLYIKYIMINIHEPNISFLDKIEILKSLSTNWIGKGKKVDEFENKLKQYLNLTNIVTVTSGTQALYEIFRLLKDKSNKKEIILSPISFVGIISSLKINDFDYTYADINKDHLSISLKSIKQKITNDTCAVVVQHYGGRPNYEIKEISEYLKKKNIFLIEDCATVIGGKIDNTHLGSYGDYSIWSFDCMKLITTLDGGAIYCKDSKDLDIIKNNIYLGLTESPTTMSKLNKDDSSKWWQIDPQTYGSRSILNNVTTSLGISQLKKINKHINRQKEVWDYYVNNIKNPKITLPDNAPSNIEESYFLFWVYSKERDKLADYLKENNIFSTFRYYPLHKTSLYNCKVNLPITEKVYKEILCIPCHKNITNKQLKYIVNKLNLF